MYASDPSNEAARFAGLTALGSQGARYPLGALLGAGTQGLVFEVPGAPCVLKVFRPSFVRGTPDLAQLVAIKEHATLAHLYAHASPYLVRYMDRGTLALDDLTLPWLALARVPQHVLGLTLAERVRVAVETTGFAFEARRAVHLLGRLALGLCALHGAGVVHRDVKPSNVLVRGDADDETPLLGDFGIVRAKSFAPTFGPGYDFGTPGYSAPESRDPSRVSVASDVFSFAAVAFLVLSGEAAFVGNEMVILALLQKGSFRPLLARAHVHPSLREEETLRAVDAILKRALSVDPSVRPVSVQAFWAELGGRLMERIRSAHAPSPVSRRDSDSRSTGAFDLLALPKPRRDEGK